MKWVYKATETKLDHVGTMLLATRDGFLCRSAYEGKNLSWADNVRLVNTGDTIHFYFRKKNGKIAPIGSFLVVEPDVDHPQFGAFGAFGARVPGTALFRVTDPVFIRRRDTAGAYQVDPVIGDYTGWALRRAGKPPPYDAKMFKNMTTLQEYLLDS